MQKKTHTGLMGLTRRERLLLTKKYAHGKILDLGCSDGALLSLFKKSQIIGVDFDPQRVKIAKKYGRAICGNALNPRLLLNKKFDTIVCNDTLEHLNNNEGAQTKHNLVLFYNNVNRLLKKGGNLIITVPLKPSGQYHPEYLQDIPQFPNFKLVYKRYLSLGTLHIDNESDTGKIMENKGIYFTFAALRPFILLLMRILGIIHKKHILLLYKKL